MGVAWLYGPNLRFMHKALGYDMRVYFAQGVKKERKALHFSAAETAYYYSTIQKLCDKYGLRFSTCYIGNDARGESFYRYQHLWNNRDDCCDAVGNVLAFQTTSASVPCVAFHGTEPRASSSKPETQSHMVWIKPTHMQSRSVTLPGMISRLHGRRQLCRGAK